MTVSQPLQHPEVFQMDAQNKASSKGKLYCLVLFLRCPGCSPGCCSTFRVGPVPQPGNVLSSAAEPSPWDPPWGSSQAGDQGYGMSQDPSSQLGFIITSRSPTPRVGSHKSRVGTSSRIPLGNPMCKTDFLTHLRSSGSVAHSHFISRSLDILSGKGSSNPSLR